MIYSGSDLKFSVKIIANGFSMDEDNFFIRVKNQWGQTKYIIQKEDMFQDDNGGWYFTMEDVHRGVYYAVLSADFQDDDYDKFTRTVTNQQYLCSVDSCGCNTKQSSDCDCTSGMEVAYRQVWTINVDGGTYLADKDGNLILTEDGKRIQTKK